FLGRERVTQVGLDRCELGLVLGRRELRDRDGGQDADDHDHDEQLDEGEAFAVRHCLPPVEWRPLSSRMRWCWDRSRGWEMATHMPARRSLEYLQSPQSLCHRSASRGSLAPPAIPKDFARTYGRRSRR